LLFARGGGLANRINLIRSGLRSAEPRFGEPRHCGPGARPDSGW